MMAADGTNGSSLDRLLCKDQLEEAVRKHALRDEIVAVLKRIASNLIQKCSLRIAAEEFRIRETEAYFHSPQHPDPFVHKQDAQNAFGNFYFHKQGKSYREGTYKGLDITVGLGGDVYGGFLIRAVESSEGELIEGPSLTVKRLLTATGCHKVKELVQKHFATGEIKADGSTQPPDGVVLALQPLSMDETRKRAKYTVYSTPRKGLTLKQAGPDTAHLQYLASAYRYTDLPTLKKAKDELLWACLAQGMTDKDIHDLAKVSLKKIDRFKTSVDHGREMGEKVLKRAASLSNVHKEVEPDVRQQQQEQPRQQQPQQQLQQQQPPHQYLHQHQPQQQCDQSPARHTPSPLLWNDFNADLATPVPFQASPSSFPAVGHKATADLISPPAHLPFPTSTTPAMLPLPPSFSNQSAMITPLSNQDDEVLDDRAMVLIQAELRAHPMTSSAIGLVPHSQHNQTLTLSTRSTHHAFAAQPLASTPCFEPVSSTALLPSNDAASDIAHSQRQVSEPLRAALGHFWSEIRVRCATIQFEICRTLHPDTIYLEPTGNAKAARQAVQRAEALYNKLQSQGLQGLVGDLDAYKYTRKEEK